MADQGCVWLIAAGLGPVGMGLSYSL